jgi:cytochrome bd ubiquinol oxidase subunit II
MSTLTVPFFVAAIGIILRGSTYVLRSAEGTTRVGTTADLVFAAASILTPFMLGAAVGGIASGRVPVGNAAGDLVTSWLNPTSAMIGAIAVVTGAYLAAVYLAADARRVGDGELEEAFRRRGLAMAVAAGALALGALPVIRDDAPRLYDGLTHGGGLACVIASAAAGRVTLGLVWIRRFELSRVTAAAAVAAIVAGWAFAQNPYLLPPYLTVDEAASPRSTLISLVVAAVLAAVLLLPSLSLLYGLLLRGRFDPGRSPEQEVGDAPLRIGRWELMVGLAAGLFIAGSLLNIFSESAWQHGIAVAALLGGIAWGFALLAVPPETPEHEEGEGRH